VRRGFFAGNNTLEAPMFSHEFILVYVTVPMIAMGLLLWAKLRRLIILLEGMKDAKSASRL
jgi:hypothetical protein